MKNQNRDFPITVELSLQEIYALIQAVAALQQSGTEARNVKLLLMLIEKCKGKITVEEFVLLVST
jgi:hypothetical protein